MENGRPTSDPTAGTGRVRLDGALILVVGARRSGTHWLQRILSAHPDVTAVPGESYLFSRGIRPLRERFQHGSLASPQVGKIYAEREQVVARLRQLCDDVLLPYLDADRSGASRLVERTPEHVQVMDLISELYPRARFVHQIRDGNEVVRSLLRQSWGPEDAGRAAAEWRDAVLDGRRQGAHLRHYTEVRYEDLAEDTEAQIRRLFDGLGLRTDRGTLAAAVAESNVVANTAGRPPGAGGLSRAQRRVVGRIAGDLLEELGYDRGGTDRQPRMPTLERLRGWIAARGTAHDGSRAEPWSPHAVQRTVDELLGAVRPGRGAGGLSGLLADGVTFRLVGEGPDVVLRGADAVTRFLGAARDDPVLGWRQVRSDTHTSQTLTTVVSTFRGPGGVAADRVFVVRLGPRGIREVVVYRLPLEGTGDHPSSGG